MVKQRKNYISVVYVKPSVCKREFSSINWRLIINKVTVNFTFSIKCKHLVCGEDFLTRELVIRWMLGKVQLLSQSYFKFCLILKPQMKPVCRQLQIWKHCPQTWRIPRSWNTSKWMLLPIENMRGKSQNMFLWLQLHWVPFTTDTEN